MYDESFEDLPEFDLHDKTLYIFDRAANAIKVITFNWNYWNGYSYITSGNKVASFTLPGEIQIKQDPLASELNRQLMAQNICQ